MSSFYLKCIISFLTFSLFVNFIKLNNLTFCCLLDYISIYRNLYNTPHTITIPYCICEVKFCQLSFYVWKWSLQTSLGKMTIDFSRFYSKICSKMSSCMIFLSIFPEANHARHIYLLTFAFLLTLSMSAGCLA